jgi:DHA1 family bicyclomycin/chloramphenicol resistance-like MFS transporter
LALASLPESRTLKPGDVPAANVWRNFRALAINPRFMGLSAIGGFGMAAFAIFLANSSFVFQHGFGLSPPAFSLAFAVNAIGFIAGAQMAAGLERRIGARRTLLVFAGAFAALATLLTIILFVKSATLPVVVGGLIAIFACLGVIAPTSMAFALEDQGIRAGTASSLAGTIQMVLAACAIPLSAIEFDGSARTMVSAIAACALLAAITTALTLGHSPAQSNRDRR